MRSPIISFLVLACSATLPCVGMAETAASASSASFDPKEAPVQVRVLYRQAETAFLAKDFATSRKLLLDAWSIQPNVDVALSLGQTDMQMKAYAEASTYLEYAIQHFLPSESEQLLDTVKAALAEAKSHAGQLTIDVNRDGAEIRVDGKSVGISPIGRPIFVDTGTHELSAQLNDKNVVRTIEASPGGSMQVRLELAQDAPKSESPHGNVAANRPPATPASSDEPSLIPVIVGGAVFAVGVGTAIGFGLAADSKDNTAKALRAENGRSGCVGSVTLPASCAEQYDAAKTGDRYSNLSKVGMVMAGVALVATPVYWFWPRSSRNASSTRRNWSLDANANPNSAHVHLSLDF